MSDMGQSVLMWGVYALVIVIGFVLVVKANKSK